MTYFFETYGCQMNVAESASVALLFDARGWTRADSAESADVAVINTCSVRKTAENRIYGRLGWYSGLKAARAKDGARPLTLVVMGCMAERLLHSLKANWPRVDYVVGTFARKKFGDIISAVEEGRAAESPDDSPSYEFAPLSYSPGSFSSFVPIMNGCDNFCSYCIVPYTRGREVSRPHGRVMDELDALSSLGVKEATLLGQNVNSYRDGDVGFAELLEKIARHLESARSSIKWLRFTSSHPKDFSDDVIETVARNKSICRHIHLPAQHGSNKILSAMNRRYTREDYMALVKKIRDAIPGVSITTDMMVGFPGETEEDFEELLSFMRAVRYENAFMYHYNPREGTKAAAMGGQVPLETKKARLARLIETQLQITSREMQKKVGDETVALVESVSRDSADELLAKTESDERVVFAGGGTLIGRFVRVKIESLNGQTFRGTLVALVE